MKAALVKRHNKVKFVDLPVPKPVNTEVLIKIDACGVCGSDFIEANMWAGRWKRFGHEIAATVVETGDRVEGLAAGDQVVVALSVPCGACDFCVGGNPRKCKSMIVAEQGGFAEYLLVKDYRLLYKVAPAIPSELACLAEPLTVILDAFELANLKPGDNLLVVGGGNIGTMSVLAAKALGINVIGVLSRKISTGLAALLNDAGAEHFKWHTLAGVTLYAPVKMRLALSRILRKVVVLHTAPSCYIPKYLRFLPYDTTIVNIGLGKSARENIINLDASKMIFKRLQLLSAFPVPCMHFEKAVELLRNNSTLFSILEREPMTLEQLPDIISNRKIEGKKIVITVGNRL